MDKSIPIYRCTVDGLDDTGIFAVSFVDCPAIERDFIALAKSSAIQLRIDRQKQLLTGALLIPDQKIYRYDPEHGEYYITFSKNEIERIALKMMRTRIPLGETTHQHEKPLSGNYLAELWIVRDPSRDKSVAIGLGELPEGTLVVSYKVEDRAYWRREVLTGNVKGFSLEGIFNFNRINMSKQPKTNARPAGSGAAVKRKKGKLVSFLLSMVAMLEGETEEEAEEIVDVAKKDETDSGEPFIIYELAEGGEIWVDGDFFCTIEKGEQAPAGEHRLADGNVIVIDDAGLLIETKPETDGAESSEADVAMAKQRGKAFLKWVAEERKQGRTRSGKGAIKAFLRHEVGGLASGQAETELAELKTRIAALEKQPSAQRAVPEVEGAGNKRSTATTAQQRMAEVVKFRQNSK